MSTKPCFYFFQLLLIGAWVGIFSSFASRRLGCHFFKNFCSFRTPWFFLYFLCLGTSGCIFFFFVFQKSPLWGLALLVQAPFVRCDASDPRFWFIRLWEPNTPTTSSAITMATNRLPLTTRYINGCTCNTLRVQGPLQARLFGVFVQIYVYMYIEYSSGTRPPAGTAVRCACTYIHMYILSLATSAMVSHRQGPR